jgi:hypothetical protein
VTQPSPQEAPDLARRIKRDAWIGLALLVGVPLVPLRLAVVAYLFSQAQKRYEIEIAKQNRIADQQSDQFMLSLKA